VSETTNSRVSKVEAADVEAGQMGQRYLAAGAQVGMRLWAAQPPSEGKPEAARDYETVGYVVTGRAGCTRGTRRWSWGRVTPGWCPPG
jgi:hypothetical protein